MIRLVKKRTSRFVATAIATVGIALALSGCGTVYDLPLPGGANVGSNPLKVHIMFRDVMDLVPQSTVKVNDVTVGRVTAVSLHTVTAGCPATAPGGKCQVADVTVEIPRATDLPANAVATIRQTSLLGEKFVSLAPPAANPQGKLVDGATIGLDNSGTNPEVEQVLEAMGALLSGGGVGQLKLISDELNQAIGGKESQVRDLLTNLHYFMGQLDQSKAQIVTAIDNLNRLAVNLQQQNPTLAATLDQMPAALASINGQRADLVKMLTALNNLSGIGVQVIQASKTATINSLSDLAPVLSELAASGHDLPNALQLLLTYPFPDATVGTTPAAARNFEMGDYTNLSINLDLDLLNLTIPGLPGMTLNGLVQVCNSTPLAAACKQMAPLLNTLCSSPLKALCTATGTPPALPSLPVPGAGGTSPGSSGGTPSTPLPTPPGGSGGKTCILGLCLRPAYGSDGSGTARPTSDDGMSFLILQGAMQ